MEPQDLKKALAPIHDGIVDMQKSAEEQKAAQEKIQQQYEASEKAFTEWKATKDHRDELNQKALDDLLKKANAVPLNGGNDDSFESKFKIALAENHETIKKVRKGFAHDFQIKATMLESTNLTGTGAVRSYLAPVQKPGTAGYNFRELTRIVNTATGWITIPREASKTGSISKTFEGNAKPNVDYTITMNDYKAEYIAGYVRISKQMLQDLPFLQSWLPQLLIRDFYIAENTQFYGDLAAVATGNSTTSATVYAEKLIDWMANLGAAGFVPNGDVTTYANWASLLKTTSGAGNAYSLPGGVTIGADGAVRIVGVPIYPTSWIATGKTIVGDWNRATIAVADPLKVEFFEQDQDNVIKNLITVRVEAREVLVMENTDAFIVA
jgi:HK97 family phage major capsid protein